MMTGNLMRGNAPQGQPNVRPSFPAPIQRPGGPSVLPRPLDNMQQFGPSSKSPASGMPPNKSGNVNIIANNLNAGNLGGPGPVPLNLNAVNSTALLSLINVAKNVINQTIMSSGGPNSLGPNPFALRGPGPSAAAYLGPPNKDVSPRISYNSASQPAIKGPPIQPQVAIQKNANPGSYATGLQSNPVPPGNPQKAPGSYPGPVSNIKAQQAQQRQELLSHAAHFLNPKVTANTATKPPAMISDSQPSKPEDKKPALAMVSNPSLVGTSVKINLTASSNTRAPAIPVTAPSTASASGGKMAAESSSAAATTATLTASSSASSVSSAGSKGRKE